MRMNNEMQMRSWLKETPLAYSFLGPGPRALPQLQLSS